MMSDLIPGAGFHDLSDEVYFTRQIDPGDGIPVFGLSQSAAKYLLPPSTPAHFQAYLANPPAPTAALDFGHIAHLMALGKGQPYQVVPDTGWKTQTGKDAAPGWSTTEAKAAVAEVEAAGLIAVKPADAATIEAMAEALLANSAAAEILTDPALMPEVTLCVQDPQTGIWLLGKADLLGPNIIADYKTFRGLADPASFAAEVWKRRYHMQSAWYLSLCDFLGQPRPQFVFIVQEKNLPYEVGIYDLSGAFLENGFHLMRQAIDLYAACLEAGEWPGLLQEMQTLEPPPWANSGRNIQDEIEIESESIWETI